MGNKAKSYKIDPTMVWVQLAGESKDEAMVAYVPE